MPSVSSIAAQTLQRRIAAGEFRFGEALPSQRELSDSLGISRASLREAISMLEALGLVRAQAGKGVFVTAGAQPEPADLPQADGAMAPAELFEFRFAVEPAWAGFAARRADDAGRAELTDIQQQMEAALEVGDLVMASEWDLRFHLRLAALSGNPALAALATQFRNHIAHSLRLPFSNPRSVWQPVDEHRAILAAVARGDGPSAGAAMRAHLAAAAGRVGIDFVQPD